MTLRLFHRAGRLGGNSARRPDHAPAPARCIAEGRSPWLCVWIGLVAVAVRGLAQVSVSIYSPTNGTVYLQPTNVPLTVQISVSVSGEYNAPTDLYDGTNHLGWTSLQLHHVLAWSNIAFGDHELVAIHRASTGPVTSSVVRVRVAYGGHALVTPGSAWHYRDGGVDLGTAWHGTNVDVSTWLQGPAKLGFGDDDVVTQVNWQNPTNGEVFPTYYFRRGFTVADPAGYSNLVVRLRRDDGAIVYLNGEELLRDNLPEGEVNSWTYALGTVPDESEFVQWWVNRARLRAGVNYLAVEIHNSGPQNHDIGFDLALVGDVPVPVPKLEISRQGGKVVASWPAGYNGYRVESATALQGSVGGWERLTNEVAQVQGRMVLTNQVDAAARYFRLRLE